MDLRITQYSHYFSVFGYTVKGREYRRSACDKFIETGLVKKRGRFHKEQKRIFARRDQFKEEFCFHITYLPEFIEGMKFSAFGNLDYELIEVPVHEGKEVVFDQEISPWENQVPIIDFCVNENKINVITAQAGFGKAQSLNSLVRVPGGWKRMGDMVVGNTVITPDGGEARVTGVYPQGTTEVWRVHFADGRYTDVNPEHLWSVMVEGESTDRVIDTRAVKRGLGLMKPRISIPLFEGEDVPEKEYEVDPYALGVMCREGTADKGIPDCYLEGSLKQRTALLQGLLNSNEITSGSTLFFYSVSRSLTESVQYLVRSLGGIALLVTQVSGTEEKEEYQLFIHLRNDSLRLDITHIEERLPEATQCIMIDHPSHLYVTDDFIVTHNTTVALAAAAKIGRRFAVMTQGGYESRWIPEFYVKLNLKPHEVRSCCGCAALYKLLREVKATGIPHVKVIFLSNATIRDFVKNYNSGKNFGSGCEDIDPANLWEFLDLGLLLVDEAHKETHVHMISALISNIKKIIYLTATLFPNTDFMRDIYKTMFPLKMRLEPGTLNVYVECVRTLYNLKDWQKARYIGGQGSYSHTTYEQWIMADKKREGNYFTAIYQYALNNWMIERRPEHKLLIFAATIEMCQKLRDFFRIRACDLISESYTSGDDYQILLDSDVIFSTVGKSGTAVDIPDLTQAYLTVALDAPNANVQALGRIRELKGDKKVPQSYHVFICMNIDKHIAYWESKEKLFKGRITGIRTAYLDRAI